MSCETLKKLFLVLIFYVCCSSCDLNVSGVKCGSKTCQPLEYCSSYDRLCKPCAEVCNDKTHNYQADVCIRDCQDYIHDSRYVRKGGDEDLRAVVQRLNRMVVVALTLVCILLITLAFIACLQVYRWKKRDGVTFANLRSKLFGKKSDTTKPSGNGVTQTGGKPDLRLDMPTPATQSEHSPVTVTTSISRRPAEDSALDYAYDNPAMSTTPGPHSKAHESTF